MADLYEEDDVLIKYSIRDVIDGLSHDVEEKTGRPFSTYKWPNRLIYFHLVNRRAELYYATRKQNKEEGNYENYNEVIPCVEMKEIDLVECPCAPKSGCFFLKSVYPMPVFLNGLPTAVTTITGFEKYEHVEWPMFKHRINNRLSFMNKSLLFTTKVIENKTWLYTYQTRDDMRPEMVSVQGVPIDPMQMQLFPVCGKEMPDLCDILEFEFIIEKRLLNQLYTMAFASLVQANNATQIGDMKADDRNANTAPDERL